MSELRLSSEELSLLENRLVSLEEQGVIATEDLSGELNMSGCASGYCQAWA